MKAEITQLKETLGGNLAENVDLIIFCAETNGWHLVQVDQKTYMLGFKMGEQKHPRINVYVTKSTFVTQIDHPTKGKTQLFRRNVWPENYDKIFANPRVHTGRGYYRRSDRK